MSTSISSIVFKRDLRYWIYSREHFALLHTGMLNDVIIEEDYLSRIETDIKTVDEHALNQYSNDLIVIKDGREEIYFGVITSYISPSELVCVDFLNYLDFTLNMKQHLNTNIDWIQFLTQKLTAKYITNSDTFELIPNLQIIPVGSVTSTYIADAAVMQLNELRQWLFKKHNIVVDVELRHNDKQILVYIQQNNNATRGIATNIHDVINVTNIDFSNQTNKLVLYDTDNPTVKLGTYYLYKTGLTGTDPNGARILPINEVVKYCTPAEVDANVNSVLSSYKYNEELSFEVLNTSSLLDVKSYNIGDPLIIYYSNFVKVTTKVSGISRRNEYTKFTCGVNRYTLENYLMTKGTW